MKNTALLALGVLACTGAAAFDASDKPDARAMRESQDQADDPPRLGSHFTREEHERRREDLEHRRERETLEDAEREARRDAKRPARTPPSPNMTYHGGKIMTTVVSKAIFWGPKWADPAFAKDKITGLDNWYTYHSGSNYAAASNEYTGSNGKVGSTGLLHLGHVIDTTKASNGAITSAILGEVCRMIPTPDPQGNGYYPVYTDVRRGRAGYCAWHSYGTCHGIPVQFGFFFDLEGDSGCDPGDNPAITGHSQGLAALANVTGHEIAEARSDPANPGAWYDPQGAENGDKCAWTFNTPYVTFSDGGKWRIQGEWSNAAYNNKTGYANLSGQKGCLDGH
ncbi:MAG TPA: hypothetical protein VHA82_15820 [Ramlibacter sp.]|uniref:hypothetical protein n=1 Tax=Ramlibacter sp. TaxID=1917967 RepID=UPI002C6FDE13|nr:hypothetical protein [Ramlibacter sp.]HVZ45278.1 hypothetical protein [Ramlibacter sp.]